MITDCSSFLVEYLFSENPIIHLKSQNGISYNKVSSSVVKNYYSVKNQQELNKMLEKIILNQEDPKKLDRLKIKNELAKQSLGASNRIVNYLKSILLNSKID